MQAAAPPLSRPVSRRRSLARLAFTGTLALLTATGCRTTSPPPAATPSATASRPAPVRHFSKSPPRTQGAAPSIAARAAIVVHANSGTVMHTKNADVRYPVASTQKVLTALILCEEGNLKKPVRVATSDTRVEPSKMGIRAGQVYPRDHLIKAFLVRSSNDIASCLARDFAGSEASFAQVMNRRARELRMYNSNFRNASGLPASNQYSTARDLSILAAHAMRQPVIRDAVSTRSMTFYFADGRTKRIDNTNKVLRMTPLCNGMKTGYTHASGKCLISTASYQGHNVIVVVLGSKVPRIWDESKRLLHWGLGLAG